MLDVYFSFPLAVHPSLILLSISTSWFNLTGVIACPRFIYVCVSFDLTVAASSCSSSNIVI